MVNLIWRVIGMLPPEGTKVLVHAHVYYVRMWNELENCIKNISLPYELFVTLVQDNPKLRQEILKFNPSAQIRIVENRGYDVWPFIDTLNRVNLDDYAYIVKIHTKRDTDMYHVGNGYSFENDGWRKALLKFVSSPKIFNKCCAAFEKKSGIGMITSFDCIHGVGTYPDALLYAKRNYPDYVLGLSDYKFVTGTMFMARAEIFKPIQKMNIDVSLFAVPDKKHSTQFAHVMERTFGEAVYYAGYTIADPISSQYERKHRRRDINIKIKFSWISLFQFKYIKKQKLVVKVFGIPLWKSTFYSAKTTAREK